MHDITLGCFDTASIGAREADRRRRNLRQTRKAEAPLRRIRILSLQTGLSRQQPSRRGPSTRGWQDRRARGR